MSEMKKTIEKHSTLRYYWNKKHYERYYEWKTEL